MAHAMLPLLERTPVIPAVKEPETLDRALCHDGAAVFLLCGDILNIGELVDRVHRAGKQAVIHADLIAGLAPKEIAVDYLRRCGADGIISTRPHLIRRGRELGMLTVLRVFAIDSKAVSNLGKETGIGMPDLIEVLPGTIYKVIARLSRELPVPLIAGGLLADKADVTAALSAGAVCFRQRPGAVGPVTAAFLGLEAALYAVFLTMDLTGGSGDPVKYASIAVCLVFSVLFACRGGSRLMPAAMALTLGADTFLLLLNDHYGAGVALFCGVQALYLVRICRRNGGRTLWPLRLVLVLGAWAGLWALGLLSPLNLLAAVYFTNFLLNACQAVPLHSPLFSVGLWLFLLCDVCVGIRNQPELFPGWLAAFAQVGMWLFYLPGQVLLVLSGRKEPTK